MLLKALYVFLSFYKFTNAIEIIKVGSPEETFEAISHSLEAFERLNKDDLFGFEVTEFQILSSIKCRIEDFDTECEHEDNKQPLFLDLGIITSSIFSNSDIEDYPDLQLYPAMAVGVVPIYNIPEVVDVGASDVVLTPLLLAKIFQSTITRWNDPEILSLNPGVSTLLPDALIRVCVRKDSSGATEIFKKYLSNADPEFAASIGVSSNSSWGPLSAQYKAGKRGVLSYVTTVEYSISYFPFDPEMLHGSPMIQIKESSGTVEANQENIQHAVYDLGTHFAGDQNPGMADPNYFTADLHSSVATSAWPIVGYSYFALRKDITKENIDCDIFERVNQFLDWFYNAQSTRNLLQFLGFGFFPIIHVEEIEDHFWANIYCQGDLVEPHHHRGLTLAGPNDFSGPFGWFESVFNGQHGDDEIVDVHFNSTLGEGEDEGSSYEVFISGEADIIVAHHFGDGNRDQSNLLELPYFATQLAIIINLCAEESPEPSCNSTLILDSKAISGIFDGSITMWNDNQLTSLNPFLSEYPYPIKPILTTYKEEVTRSFMYHVVEEDPGFQLNESFAVENNIYHVEAYVFGTPYSIGVTFFKPELEELSQVTVAHISNANGIVSYPSMDVMAECVEDGFEFGGHLIDFHEASGLQDCTYPYVTTYYLFLYESYESTHCEYEPALIADFVDFLIKDDGHGALYHHGFLPLVPMVDQLYEYVQQRVDGISCSGESILLGEVVHVMQEDALTEAVLSLTAVCCILSILALGWVVFHRKMRIIRFSQPLFLYIMLVGCVVYTLTLIPLAMNEAYFPPKVDEYGRENYPALDTFCQFIPWLYTTGFTLIFGSLLGKTWRIKEIFINPELKKKVIKNKSVLLQVGSGVALSWAICLCWTVDAPLHWITVVDQIDPLNGISPIEYHERCGSEKIEVYLPLILIIQLICFIYGTVLSYKIRMLKDDFSETTSINLGMFTNMQALLFVIALGWMEQDNPTVLLLVNAFFILLGGFGTMALITVPKMWIVHFSSKVSVDHVTKRKNKSKDPLASHTSSSQQAGKRELLTTKVAAGTSVDSSLSTSGRLLGGDSPDKFFPRKNFQMSPPCSPVPNEHHKLLPIRESSLSPTESVRIHNHPAGSKSTPNGFEGLPFRQPSQLRPIISTGRKEMPVDVEEKDAKSPMHQFSFDSVMFDNKIEEQTQTTNLKTENKTEEIL